MSNEYKYPDNLSDALGELEEIHHTLYCMYKHMPTYYNLQFDYHNPIELAHDLLGEVQKLGMEPGNFILKDYRK